MTRHRGDPSLHRKPKLRTFVGILFLTVTRLSPCPVVGDESSDRPQFRVTYISGKVVWYGEALERRLGVTAVPESLERILALETDDGQLLPMIEDTRARAFRIDDRLRKMHVKLRVRQYEATPAIQVLGVFELRNGKTLRIDYWCDICAITMYEAGPCSCCQADNRLRRREVDEP